MTEEELRELLPGSGDLAEMVREVMEERYDYISKFSDAKGKYLLDKIIDWIIGTKE